MKTERPIQAIGAKTNILVAIVLFFCAFPLTNSADQVLSNALAKDIGQAYGYYVGQSYSLGGITKRFPDLEREAKIAELRFDAEFKSSIDGMDSFMNEQAKDDWDHTKGTFSRQIKELVDIESLSESEAMQFIELVNQRAKGNIESPVLETLLMFKAGYEEHPEKEFSDGFRYKYSHDGTGKAKDVPFSIQIPKTWLAKEGDRPNIIQKFVSKNGRGFEIVMLLIGELPLAPGEKITSDDVDEILNPNDIEDFVPDNFIATKYGKLTLENLPGFWIKYSGQMTRVRNTIQLESITYYVFYKNKMIQIQGQVMNSINGEPIGEGSLEKFEPLFDLIANSLVIDDLYAN